MGGHFAGGGGAAVALTSPPALDFNGLSVAASAVAEAQRLAHGHLFNPAFASEISRIDPLPHQRIAVYERMMLQQPLRFLLADDAGAGKTIMAGLYMREMLLRDHIRRILIVPPAGLVGNWERELRTLFRLSFQIVAGDAVRDGNPFANSGSDLVIVSVDTLARETAFDRLREAGQPYDLVVFDEAHKLAASRQGARMRRTRRYILAEALAGIHSPTAGPAVLGALGWAAQHLLLLTATPHMGRDYPYYCLWRLLDPEVFGSEEAFRKFPVESRARYFIRRTKEEMIGLDGQPLYPPRVCDTFSYDLSPGAAGEQALYEATNHYLRNSYDLALQSNRPAARLAVGVFQRRLASSTWALLRSFERRIEKLQGNVKRLQSGEADSRGLREEQKKIESKFGEDFFETHGAEDEREGLDIEECEEYELAVLGATVAVTIEDLQSEIADLENLRDQARALCNSGDESKFNKLQEVLQDPRFADEKWLIFTEHRDTADYLVRRLEGRGFTGQVAQIHGGMAWPEREEQVEHFRNPDGARYMIATDAAGEGINLQFCRLMTNYDLPWNPARLEQRMGRIHRYGQKHRVHIFNLVAGGTREGQVLKTLLEKIEAIRSELRSDKVFDVIGRLFENIPLPAYMAAALTEEGVQDACAELKGRLTAQQMNALEERERSLYGGGGEVKVRLGAIQREIAGERYLHLLPGYVRCFVESAAALLDLKIDGDLDGEFLLTAKQPGALEPLLPAFEENYPAEAQRRLCVRRPEPGEPGIWLHPGEPVFDALCEEVTRRFGKDAMRGAIFTDPEATAPYLFYLATASVEQHNGEAPGEGQRELIASTSRPLERSLLALRQNEDGVLAECAIEHLLLLRPADDVAPGAVPLAARAASMRAKAAECALQMIEKRAEQRRENLRADLPGRIRQVKIGFRHRELELVKRRGKIIQRGDKDEGEITQIGQELEALKKERQRALDRLEAEPGRIAPGAPRFFVHALVVPDDAAEAAERYDARVEEFAVRFATAWEKEHGASVQDVSKPKLARAAGLPDWPGFDLCSNRPGGEERLVEVKGRAGEGVVKLSGNEWRKACNHDSKYWLYVVFNCATSRPRLLRIQNPFHRLILGASEQMHSTIAISASQLREAAEDANGEERRDK